MIHFQPGVHYLHGINHDMGVDEDESNGAGKSVIFQAIQWCFFGTLPGDRAKLNADDVINDQEEANCRVHLVVEHNGRKFDIVRSRKDENYGTGLRFWSDGEEKTKHTQAETELRFAELIPITERIFLYAIQVGQGMPDRFMKLPEGDKHKLLCKIIGLRLYDDALKKAKDGQAEASLQAQVEEAAVRELETQHAQITQALAAHEREMEAYRNKEAPDLEQIQQQAESLRVKADGLETSIQQLQAQVAANDAGLQQQSAERDTLTTETRALGEVLSQKERDAQGRYNDLMRLKEDIDRLSKDVEGLRSTDPEKCPTCQQLISDRSALDAHIAELQAQADAKTQTYTARLAEYTPVQSELAPLREEYKAKLARADQAVASVRDFRMTTESLRGQIDTQRAAQAAALREREHLLSETSRHETALAEIRGRLEQSKTHLAEVEKDHAAKDALRAEAQSRWMHWKFWVQEIPNLRSKAITTVLHYLNRRIEEYLDYLTSGTLGLELYQEAYGKGMRIKARLRGERYEAASGGQQKRIDLSLFLALSDLLQHSSGFSTNILVCDEIMDGLSPPGVSRWLSLLQKKAAQGTSVFVISHNPSVSQVFPFDSTHIIERRNRRAVHRVEGALAHA